MRDEIDEMMQTGGNSPPEPVGQSTEIQEWMPELRAEEYAEVLGWHAQRLQLGEQYEKMDGEWLYKIQQRLVPKGLWLRYLQGCDLPYQTAQDRINRANGTYIAPKRARQSEPTVTDSVTERLPEPAFDSDQRRKLEAELTLARNAAARAQADAAAANARADDLAGKYQRSTHEHGNANRIIQKLNQKLKEQRRRERGESPTDVSDVSNVSDVFGEMYREAYRRAGGAEGMAKEHERQREQRKARREQERARNTPEAVAERRRADYVRGLKNVTGADGGFRLPLWIQLADDELRLLTPDQRHDATASLKMLQDHSAQEMARLAATDVATSSGQPTDQAATEP